MSFLTRKQKNELLNDHRAEDKKRFADRIKTILSLDKGYSVKEISDILLINESTVRRYKKAYDVGGLEELIEDGYRGAGTKLTQLQETNLKAHLQENTYLSTKEIIFYVEATYKVNFSSSGMRDLLHRLGFSYKKPKVVPGKASVESQLDFMLLLESLRSSLRKHDRIYFADASHPHHNSMPSHGWILKGHEKELKTNAGRQRMNLHGAIDINDFHCVMRDDPTIDFKSTLNLIKEIERRNPRAKKIYLILDNARYYIAKEVQEYLSTSRVEFVHLPPYSPNLNIIERLWKFFHKEVMYNQYYEHFVEFREASMCFFKNLKIYKKELRSLLSEKVEFVAVG